MAITILSYGLPTGPEPLPWNAMSTWARLAWELAGTLGFFFTERPLTANGNLEGAPQSAEHLRIQHSSVQIIFSKKVFAIVLCSAEEALLTLFRVQRAGLVGMVSAGGGDRRGNDKLIYIFLRPTNCPNILTKVKWYGIDDLYGLTCECSTN